jgi:hypothetical protein
MMKHRRESAYLVDIAMIISKTNHREHLQKKRLRLYIEEVLSEWLLGQLGSNLGASPMRIDQK